MPETTQFPIAGREYRFETDSFVCKNWDGPVRYEDILEVTNVPGNGCFDIRFTTQKGKTCQVSVFLEGGGQGEALRAALLERVPGARVSSRPQTAWEACGTWVTAGLCLAGLVVLIIALNTWGRGTSVVVPVWMLPVLTIGSILSTPVLAGIAAAILVLFGVGAVRSLGKRKPVWVLSGRG